MSERRGDARKDGRNGSGTEDANGSAGTDGAGEAGEAGEADGVDGPGDVRDVAVAREPVELYKVLKFEGLANSGGEAKVAVDEGLVRVNGEIETRRRRKLVDGDTVAFAGATLRIRRA